MYDNARATGVWTSVSAVPSTVATGPGVGLQEIADAVGVGVGKVREIPRHDSGYDPSVDRGWRVSREWGAPRAPRRPREPPGPPLWTARRRRRGDTGAPIAGCRRDAVDAHVRNGPANQRPVQAPEIAIRESWGSRFSASVLSRLP